MAHRTYDEFCKEREALNELVLDRANLEIKRFFSLDSQAYRAGELPTRTKEMLGLVASLVLRCDDCIAYHVGRCREEGVTDGELQEVLSIGLVVGGSIVIPHLRRAVRTWEETGYGDAPADGY
jgi:AhpD family alkylhydroperoxidase